MSEQSLADIASALTRLAEVAEKWYQKTYPVKPEPKDATITHLPTDEERLENELAGDTSSTIEEWRGPRELEIEQRENQRRERAAARHKRSKGGST